MVAIFFSQKKKNLEKEIAYAKWNLYGRPQFWTKLLQTTYTKYWVIKQIKQNRQVQNLK